MKPFKFRVWHYPSEDFVEMTIIINYEGKITLCNAYENQEGKIMLSYDCHEGIDITDNPDFEISYSTGIFDNNNKEIYFGDILQHKKIIFLFDTYKDNLQFNCGCCDDILGWECNTRFYEYEMKDTKIIGNKYENPKLLENINES